MEGVTILSQDTDLICSGFSPLYIIFIVMTIFGLGMIIASFVNDWSVGLTASFLLVFAIGAFMLAFTPLITADRVTTYKVTIDDSVSFIEFTDKYEIKDREGKIFTVYEKSSLDQA